MLSNSHRRATFLALAMLVESLWGEAAVANAQSNFTFDDTDPSLNYSPPESWTVNSTDCSFCLKPAASIAFGRSWHHGLHIIPIADEDDEKGDNSRRGLRRRDGDNPFETGKFDEDDPQFVDVPVTVDFQFTGSAVYVYGIIPLGVAAVNNTPTFMNLTYTLDGRAAGSFVHTGSATASGFIANKAVFAMTGLSDGPHSLHVDVGPDSVFLLDYIDVTSGNASDPSASSPSGSQGQGLASNGSASASGTAPSSMSSPKSKHNIATFAGAVGGATGLLLILSLGVAISIIRRRRRAARRDRQWQPDQDAHSYTDVTRAPSMSGPAPFVPRYFPGTIPMPPPPYVAEIGSDSRAERGLVASPALHLPAPLPPLVSPVRSPPPLISLMSPELRPQDEPEEPPSYFDHARSPRVRPSDIPLLDISMAALASDDFDYGINGLNAPPPPPGSEIAEPAPAQPRPPPTIASPQPSLYSNSNWLGRFRRQPTAASLPRPEEAEVDGLMENEEGTESEIDSLHGI